jgi:hypothetical protein
MQKRSHPLCRQVQSLLHETQPHSIGQLRPAVSTVFSVPVRMDGPVFRVFLDPPMMNPAALTKSFCSSSKTVWPVARPMCRVSKISYMNGGFWVPNRSHAMGTGDEFHVGPRILIIGPDQKMLETLNHDGSNGEPYVNHVPGRTELYLVSPIRECEDAQEHVDH